MPKPSEKREEHEQLEDLVPEVNVLIANCFYVVKRIFCMTIYVDAKPLIAASISIIFGARGQTNPLYYVPPQVLLSCALCAAKNQPMVR